MEIYLALQGDLSPFERQFLTSIQKKTLDNLSPKQQALLIKILQKIFPRADFRNIFSHGASVKAEG
jgi:hypothetical protein